MVDAISIVETHKPDILILDIGIPGGGLTALKSVRTSHPKTKVAMLTVSDDSADVMEALSLGAVGYLLKGASGRALVAALHSINDGNTYLSSALGVKVLIQMKGKNENSAHELSKREKDVLSLIVAGCRNKEIGDRFGLSEKTVKHYVSRLLKRYNVQSRTELAIVAGKAVR